MLACCRFEEGVKAQVNEELSDLREQQRAFSDHLEKLMEDSQLLDEQMYGGDGLHACHFLCFAVLLQLWLLSRLFLSSF